MSEKSPDAGTFDIPIQRIIFGQGLCNIVPIARDYSRTSQSFLFARLTRAEHDFIPRTLVFGARLGGLIMKTRYTVALSMLAGVALGAAAIQGLHAQATPKALLVTESEIVDRAKVPPYSSALTPAMQAAGGQWAS